MALVWFVDKFPRSRKPVQYRQLDDIVSFYSVASCSALVDRLKMEQETKTNANMPIGYQQNGLKVITINIYIYIYIYIYYTSKGYSLCY